MGFPGEPGAAHEQIDISHLGSDWHVSGPQPLFWTPPGQPGLSGCQAGCPPRSEDYTQFQRLEKREAEGEGSLCCLDKGSHQVTCVLPLPLLRQADTGSLGPLSPGGRRPLQPVLQLLAPFLWSEIGQIGIQAPNSSSFLAEGLRASPFSSQPISSIQGK